MPDEKRYTERDLILAKREGYARGMQAQGSYSRPFLADSARRAFPLPPQTRPRVVVDRAGIKWRVDNGTLQFRYGDWEKWEDSPAGIAILDLLANPTEPVPDEEG